MKKEEKRPVHPRWNDTSGISIIYTPTEEERKKATEKMVDTAIRNIEKFHSNEEEKSVKGLKDCQKDYSSEEREL